VIPTRLRPDFILDRESARERKGSQDSAEKVYGSFENSNLKISNFENVKIGGGGFISDRSNSSFYNVNSPRFIEKGQEEDPNAEIIVNLREENSQLKS
jgi:hypothetical protein